MAVGDTHVFPGFLTPVQTQLFFPKPPTTFLKCFCRGEGRKYAGKEVLLNWESNSQPPGHESDTHTIEPTGRGAKRINHYHFVQSAQASMGRSYLLFLILLPVEGPVNTIFQSDMDFVYLHAEDLHTLHRICI